MASCGNSVQYTYRNDSNTSCVSEDMFFPWEKEKDKEKEKEQYHHQKSIATNEPTNQRKCSDSNHKQQQQHNNNSTTNEE